MSSQINLSPPQIEQLQSQIRQFKILGKRYSDSAIPKMPIENRPAPVVPPSQSLPPSGIVPTVPPQEIKEVPSEIPPVPAAPVLSWQCFYSLLMIGPQRCPEGMIAIPPAEIGSFSKAATLPLVLTQPYVASLRERLCIDYLTRQNAMTSSFAPFCATSEPGPVMLSLQRQERVAMVNQYTSSSGRTGVAAGAAASGFTHPQAALGAGGYLHSLLPRRNHSKSRRANRRDLKSWDKDDRRRRGDLEDRRRRKGNEFLKAIVAHREEFARFHKNKHSDCARTAKAVRMWQDLSESRRDREEARAEMRRLQALKENDMEAYSKLVQETKNERLHFLINQTDSYLTAINQLVQNQRVAADDGADGLAASMKVDSSDSGAASGVQSLTKSSKEYYESTHRRTEKVSQPTMLKGGDLKEYQMSGLQWMVSLYNNNLNGILADEMGLGKTIQTIALLSYLMEVKKNNGPYMIVVPLSTLSNWVNEMNKWAPDMIKVVYKGTPTARKQLYKDEVEAGHFNLLLTTYEYIMKDKGNLRKHPWQYIIVDEGHRMKNANSKFAQTLGTSYQSKHRLLLTGTPLQNNLPELWALLNFLLPTIFSSVDTFDQWFNKPFASFKSPALAAGSAGAADGEGDVGNLTQEEKMLIVHRLHEVLRPFMLRRVKDQVLDQLPEKVEKVLRCDLSGWQRKLYNVIHTRSLPLLSKGGSKDDSSSSGGLNNAIMQLRKVCNHPYLFLDEWYMDDDLIRSSGKFELLDRMLPKLRAAGHRILMFSQMTQVMTILERFFEYRNFSHLRLDGSTSADEREKRMHMFNDPDSPFFIFLLSTRAGGLGLNLASADTVILFDSDWNPMMDAQAQDRAHRIGQKNEVRVFRLVSTSPVEERILARATDKRNLTGLVVEAGKFNKGGVSGAHDKDREAMMESLLNEFCSTGPATGPTGPAGVDDEGELIVGEEEDAEVPDDDQINEMMSTNQAELDLYKSFDERRKAAMAGSSQKALLGPDDTPRWLLPGHWTSKHSQLKDLMSGTPTPGKRGRKKGAGSAAGTPLGGDEMDFEVDDDEDEGNHDSEMIGGKVMRKRKAVVYDDGLTDLQYSKLVEKKLDEEEGLVKKDSKSRSRASVSSSRSEEGSVMDVEVGDDEEETIELEPEHVKALSKAIADIQKLKNADGLFIAELFKTKPDKVFYADYYTIIASPISLKEISAALKKGQYKTFRDIEADFALMSRNAREYNLDSSPVYLECENVRAVFYDYAAKADLWPGGEMPSIDASRLGIRGRPRRG